ncbi:tetratricopeptide repeat protein [Roseibacillus ishigakijimensis]|uniref:Tetratricopeptide repeat protein n=1 Tax=Roseibacillus ishigakijimensis TaxID=454146 RepID=A0A934RU44_9BACT|nr:tetratricopeptide repeat protein [Roseibacillus ishigakijimensis]MBK1834531.1 tetratricopeptide repeat protein [Roseibacillus ishigakijimensis]
MKTRLQPLSRILLILSAALTDLSGETITALELSARGNALMQEARNILSHDFSEAAAAYRAALAKDPNHLEGLLGMAWVANSNHDFAAGRKWAEKALARDSQAGDAHALLGDGAIELGRYEEAFTHYQAALDIRADLSTLSRSAHLLWLHGEDERAQEMMREAITSGGPHPENGAWCRAELALIQLKCGHSPKARQSAEAAVALAPGNPRALNILAGLEAGENNPAAALRLYRRSVEVMPTHDALAGIADLLTVLGEKETAARQIETVIRFHLPEAHHHGDGHHHSHGPAGHTHQASSQLALFLADHRHDLPLAVKQAKEAYEQYPNIHAADALAWSLHQNGQSEEAREWSRRARALGTSEPLFYYHAGVIEWSLDNPGQAAEFLRKALALHPHFHPLHASRAREILSKLPSQS